MPNWYFLVARHFGGANQRRQTCAKIKQQVEQHGLSDVLPLVKYELGRQLEYYLGIAVDMDAAVSNPEESARRVLVNAGVSAANNPQNTYFVEADSVQRLLSGTLGCESFTIPIAYETIGEAEAPPVERLLTELDVEELRPAEPSVTEAGRYSRLLHWCSATGSGEIGRI